MTSARGGGECTRSITAAWRACRRAQPEDEELDEADPGMDPEIGVETEPEVAGVPEADGGTDAREDGADTVVGARVEIPVPAIAGIGEVAEVDGLRVWGSGLGGVAVDLKSREGLVGVAMLVFVSRFPEMGR